MLLSSNPRTLSSSWASSRLAAAFIRISKILCIAVISLSSAQLHAATPAVTSPAATTTAVTTTMLQLSSGVTVGTGVTITLTATVTANGAPVSPGFVTFCDASAKFCEDLAVLGTTAVNTSGIATMKKVLAPGSHEISAIFNATVSNASSKSAIQSVDIPVQPQGPGSSSTIITKSARTNPLPVQATVTGVGTATVGGALSIVQDQDKHTLATAPVGPSTAQIQFSPLNAYQGLINSSLPNYAVAMLTGDFNGDGLPDLLASVNAGFGDGTAGLVGVSLNDPARPGQFLPAQGYEPGNDVGNVVIGDFNNDGVLDVVANVNDGEFNFFMSALLLGDPSHPGQFVYGTEVSSSANFLATADLNHDGVLDLIALTTGGVDVLFGDPAHPGQFLGETVYPTGSEADAVTVADLNGDGLPDLVIANYKAGAVDVLLGDASNPGQFLAPTAYSVAMTAPLVIGNFNPIVVGDFNQDGHPDLATTLSTGAVAILLNDPSSPGHFLAPVNYPFYSAPSILTIGDFNGDGVLDIAAIGGSVDQGINVLSGDPAQPGKFLPVQYYPRFFAAGIGTYSLAAADFNADNLTDLAFLQTSFEEEFQGTYPFGTLLTQRTQTAIASFPSLAYDGSKSPVAHAVYSGDENYTPSQSCSIDLSGHQAAPVLYDVHVTNIGKTDATIAWYWDGEIAAVDYGPSDLYSTTGWLNVLPSQPNGPSLIHLTGLSPGVLYYYDIRAIDYFSGCGHWTTTTPIILTFTTAAAAP